MIEYASRSRPVARDHVDVVGFLRRLDWILLLAVGARRRVRALGGGRASPASTSRATRTTTSSGRRSLPASASRASCVALLIDPDRYRRAQKAIFGVTLAGMLLVFPLADATRGSKRWIEIGPFQFQPSEFGKLLFVLALAGFLADRVRRAARPQVVLQATRAGGDPDRARLQAARSRHRARLRGSVDRVPVRRRDPLDPPGLIVGIVALLASSVVWFLPAAGVEVLEPYQAARLNFTNLEEDPGGTAYNQTQSITAVGSGGLDGRGVQGATQTRLDYLPEHHTDFVFAALAEQRGFFGAALLLGLYLLIVWRGLRVITISRDAFCAIVAGGIVIGFLFQVFVNVGMTMGIAPVTGIPLPFVTVGGSSMVVNIVAIGVLQAIHVRGHLGRRRAR